MMSKKPLILTFCALSSLASANPFSWIAGLGPSSSFFGGLFGPSLKVVSFGDSVASGYNSHFLLYKVKGGTYADHFGRWYNSTYDYNVKVRNLAVAGFTLDQIFSKLLLSNIDRIEESDLILLEGGGNDFLDLNKRKFIDLCKPENFYPTLEKAKKEYLKMMNDVYRHKKNSARVRALGIYYPLVHETRARPCVLRNSMAPSVHASFLKAMSNFNWFIYTEAKKRGYTYIDTFAHLNCDQKNWRLCKPSSYSSQKSYEENLFELDRKKLLKDPGDIGWLQKDRVHPNKYGHNLISWAIRNP